MDKRLIYGALCCSLLLAGGCSKKLNSFQSSFFTTDPTPLETVGQEVPATISGRIPEKFMRKNAKVTTTPGPRVRHLRRSFRLPRHDSGRGCPRQRPDRLL